MCITGVGICVAICSTVWHVSSFSVPGWTKGGQDQTWGRILRKLGITLHVSIVLHSNNPSTVKVANLGRSILV